MMSTDEPAPDDLTAETQRIWEAKAAFWDERMGEGNAFHRALVGPAIAELLDPQPGELIADIACGNGQAARWMATRGARVLATDFAARFLELARERSAGLLDRIEYRQVDATDSAQLLALGEGRFDGIVCAMALMDMPTVEPLFAAVPRLLAPGGRFVFVVPHPAFNHSGMRMALEEEDRDGQLVSTHWMQIRGYLTPTTTRGAGMPGEPLAHWYFHRPLHMLLNGCFRHGLVLDGVAEPAFPRPAEPIRTLSWLAYHDIPAVFAARLRVSHR